MKKALLLLIPALLLSGCNEKKQKDEPVKEDDYK